MDYLHFQYIMFPKFSIFTVRFCRSDSSNNIDSFLLDNMFKKGCILLDSSDRLAYVVLIDTAFLLQ